MLMSWEVPKTVVIVMTMASRKRLPPVLRIGPGTRAGDAGYTAAWGHACPLRQSVAGMPKPPGNAGDYGFLVLADGLAASALGMSPITVFNGQTENAGHFLHPATMAIGQRVMTFLQG